VLLLDLLGKPGCSRCGDRILAGRPGFDSRQGQEMFLFSAASRPGAVSQGIQRPRCEAHCSPRSSADVRNGGAISSS
jgi:hypothetical protein